MLKEARAELDILASYLDTPNFEWPNTGLWLRAVAHREQIMRIDKLFEENKIWLHL